MRIVVVGALAESLINFRGEMLRSMVSHGHDVLAAAPEDDPRVAAQLREMGVGYRRVRMRRTGLNPAHDAVAVADLVRLFRRFRPQAVLTYAAKPVVYGSIAARLASVPFRAAMITGVGTALGGSSGPRRRAVGAVLRSLYVVALRQTQLVFFQNPDDEQLFRTTGLVGRGQRTVLINGSGIDLERFRVAPLPPPPVTFIMIGRLIREKGVAEYVEAARILRRTHPQARVQLLGPLDPNPSSISSRELAELNSSGIVEYLGATHDVRPYLAASHVCVLPSYYGEGVPHSVLEAMAMGRAVITTDAPGCRETVVDGRNGILILPRDPIALADSMRLLADDHDRLAEMGRQSRAVAEERFDVRCVNRTILDAMGLTGRVGEGSTEW